MNSPALPLSRGLRIRAELKELLTLAAPIMIAQLATTAMGFVDAVMAGRASPHDLAAVALGNSIWIPMFLLMTGTLLATTAKVAQRYGAGDQPGTGRHFAYRRSDGEKQWQVWKRDSKSSSTMRWPRLNDRTS
ncbi:hypothetical protein G039_0329790 [Pseudomonas aeruginosa VRFPA01]|nr:hypothetical protein G039_0329790 [Pseudomonas aeruginosa VRFPA01]